METGNTERSSPHTWPHRGGGGRWGTDLVKEPCLSPCPLTSACLACPAQHSHSTGQGQLRALSTQSQSPYQTEAAKGKMVSIGSPKGTVIRAEKAWQPALPLVTVSTVGRRGRQRLVLSSLCIQSGTPPHGKVGPTGPL